MEKIKLVVYNEHTLGYWDPRNPSVVGILKASPLRGAIGDHHKNIEVITARSNIRLASLCDFKAYNVSFEGYDNGNYEYKELYHDINQ